MALTFCGKKSKVGASVSYGHISSLFVFLQIGKGAFGVIFGKIVGFIYNKNKNRRNKNGK